MSTLFGNISHTNARVVLAIKERTTNVKRGENASRTLKNHNIVVNEQYLSKVVAKGSYSMEIPKIVSKEDTVNLFLILENEQKDILSAARLDF